MAPSTDERSHSGLWDLVRLRPTSPPPRDVTNLNIEHERALTVGQRAADAVASGIGSWRFIIVQSCLLAVWILLNIVGIIAHWDPYPFILLNLVMSFQAAYSAPIIMMSQNRQGQKDRLAAEHDYEVNVRAEEEITAILRHLEYQDDLILELLHRMDHARVSGATHGESPGNGMVPGHGGPG
jgi:uncharacterized membrane protein